MSYTTIKRVLPNADVESADHELRNACGWSAMIFDVLAVEYLGVEPHGWLSLRREKEDALWRLVNDPRLEPFERVVFAMCFDRAWINAADVHRIPEHLEAFSAKHGDPERVNHLPRIAEILRGWDPTHGLAFYGTSVAEDLWWVDVECPHCGATEMMERRPFNVEKDTGALMLDIDKLEECTPGEKWIMSGPDPMARKV